MDLKQYVKDATRTENHIDKIETNPFIVSNILQIIIHAGSILDQIKKNVFYNKPIDIENYNAHIHHIDEAMFFFKSKNYHWSGNVEHKQDININTRMFHALVGAITESAELAEALQKGLKDSTFDFINVLEEFGDFNWYEAVAIDTMNGDFNQVLERNIAKLRKRFPEKFTSEHAIHRNLEVERSVLEGVDEKI